MVDEYLGEWETPVGQVRLLIADTDPDRQLLDDQQIAGCLAIAGQDVKRGAARALRVIAASEVLVSRKISTQDLSTDGPAVAAELRAQAEALEAEATRDDTLGGADAYAAYIPSGPGPGGEGEEWRCP
ncbi:MAG: hypothetical protein L0I17_08135 [Actinomycetia bacterium]|nr:hypothetical protein [Actinomycetes bacterium]